MKDTKLLKIQSDAGVTVDDEQIEVVELFKYLGSLKSADGIIVTMPSDLRIGIAKKRMLDLVPMSRDNKQNAVMELVYY